MKLLASILAPALLLASSAAAAQSATDAQCLILANLFAKQSKEPEQKQAAEAAAYFYMGRMKESMTPAQLKALFDSAAKPLTDANAGPKMTACLDAIRAKVALLQSLGPAPSPQPATKPQPASPGR